MLDMYRFLQCLFNLYSFCKKKKTPKYDRTRLRSYRERIRKKYNLESYQSL